MPLFEGMCTGIGNFKQLLNIVQGKWILNSSICLCNGNSLLRVMLIRSGREITELNANDLQPHKLFTRIIQCISNSTYIWENNKLIVDNSRTKILWKSYMFWIVNSPMKINQWPLCSTATLNIIDISEWRNENTWYNLHSWSAYSLLMDCFDTANDCLKTTKRSDLKIIIQKFDNGWLSLWWTKLNYSAATV